ncbi:hypothetical protein PG988_013665 [Apiospora saccharicola]
MPRRRNLANIHTNITQECARPQARKRAPDKKLGQRVRGALDCRSETEEHGARHDDLETAVPVGEVAPNTEGIAPVSMMRETVKPTRVADRWPIDRVKDGMAMMAPMAPVSQPIARPPRETAREAGM